jgi:hypothetical protein
MTLNGAGDLTTAGSITLGGVLTCNYQAIINGNYLHVKGNSPTIFLQDSDHRSCMLHCNSSQFYLLRGDGPNSTTWLNGPYPMVINLDTLQATFGVSPIVYSDKTLKTDIKVIDNALDKILSLQGVSFTWIESKLRSLGLIAQDVERVIPEIVQTDKDSGLKSLSYLDLIGVLVEAIKELNNKIDRRLT